MIDSERLVMRPVSEGEAETLLDVFSNPSVRRYLLDDSLVSLEWVRNEIVSSSQRFNANGSGLWAIRRADATEIIGFVGFRDFFDPPRLQLLYGLLPDYWGKGYATEAAGRLCHHAFDELGFTRIEAAIDVPNEPSIRVAERLGMSLMDSPVQQHDDTVFYEVDRESWSGR